MVGRSNQVDGIFHLSGNIKENIAYCLDSLFIMNKISCSNFYWKLYLWRCSSCGRLQPV